MKEWTDRLFGPTAPDVGRLMELDEFRGPDTATLERLARVFEHPAMLEAYAEEWIAQAFLGPQQQRNVCHERQGD